LLRRKRLYVVKSTILDKHEFRTDYSLLFVPRIKIRPREHSVGSFLRKSLLKPTELNTASYKFKQYADLRKDKAAKIRRRPKPKKLNRWLSKRMFRGAGRCTLISRKTLLPETYKNSLPFSFVDAPLQKRNALTEVVKRNSLRQIYSRYYSRTHRHQK
jgi:hypothetical protein